MYTPTNQAVYPEGKMDTRRTKKSVSHLVTAPALKQLNLPQYAHIFGNLIDILEILPIMDNVELTVHSRRCAVKKTVAYHPARAEWRCMCSPCGKFSQGGDTYFASRTVLDRIDSFTSCELD